jgi:7,8-dihydropterin-6-yl-methyl-4-(beta-D-ribofuranosyl)aminobenzene 5'-phosphate synthase
MLKISCLNDDRCNITDLESEHGLSLYIENNGVEILFDVGQGPAFKNNAAKMGIDFSKLEYLVLSHGHYDHTDGLKYIDGNINVLCHPNCTIWRKSKRTNKYNGIPYSKEELGTKFNVIMTKEAFKINEEIVFLGEIARINDFECKKFPSVLENGDEDFAIDDTGIAIDTPKGIVVISGCGHSGICNTIEQAKRLIGKQHVYCVIGGFHLKECDEQTNKTIEYMKNNDIERLILGHCTADIVCEEFIKQLSQTLSVEVLSTGKKYIV